MKETTLDKVLKGHEGETFYNPYYGDVVLSYIDDKFIVFDEELTGIELFIKHNGCSSHTNEPAVFPSKDQQDWNIWIDENKLIEEQKLKTPKTWSELTKSNNYIKYWIGFNMTDGSPNYTTERLIPIEKSALALLKIHQLIEVGYGGNITKEEWKTNCYYWISANGVNSKFYINHNYNNPYCHIAFHTKEQAEEFLSYSENIQLLEDYFQLT